MKLVYKYLLFSVLLGIFMSCSDDKEVQNDIIWNRFRTTNILVYSHLSDLNLFATTDYKEIATSIRNTSHSVAVLDRSNVLYGSVTMANTGVEVARDAQKVPVFVPGSYDAAEKKMMGNTILLPSNINSMEQYTVEDYCKLLDVSVNAFKTEKMSFSSITINDESLIASMLQVFKEKVKNETILVGTIDRSLMANLQSATKSILLADSYKLSEIKNRDSDSQYCIFLLSSSKWELRETIESHVAGDINCYQLQVEFLK